MNALSLVVALVAAQEIPDGSVVDAGVEAVVEVDAGALEVGDAGAPWDAGEAVDAGSPVLVAVDAGVVQVLPKGFVGIKGRVIDARTAEPLIEATVKVVSGAKKSALTDVDGFYKLKLPPGMYELRVFYELYQGRRIGNVEVKAGQVTTLDVELSADSRSVQEVVVEAKVDKRKEAALLQERKKAAVVSDSIGAQEMARTPDANAGDAVKRVVSASVVDGRYVFLRGLGGRYALTLLNGTLLPSPEPDEPSVPLDLFPTALLSDLNVLKTYSPELPASFGGGTLLVDTTTFPTALDLRAKLTVGGDTESTFQQRLTEKTTPLGENFGFTDGSRKLPSAFPTNGPAAIRDGFTKADRINAAASLPNEWTLTRKLALPNTGLSLQVGDTIKLGGDKRLGFLVAGQWNRREQIRRQHIVDPDPVAQADGSTAIVGQNPFDSEVGLLSGTSSLLANVGLQLSRDHELSYLALLVSNVETQAISQQGELSDSGSKLRAQRINNTQRFLFFNQLKGFHRLHVLNDAELDWQLNYSRVARSEPDIRDVAYEDSNSGLGSVWSSQPGSGDRFFVDLTEQSGGGTLNVTIPIRSALKLKLGGLGQYSNRDFSGRRFRYRNRGGLGVDVLTGAPEGIFTKANLEADTIRFEENTAQADAYQAGLAVYGGFLSADWKPLDWLRVQGGARYEGSTIDLTAKSLFSSEAIGPTPVKRSYNDVAPALNVIISPRDTINLRGGYAYTLARPTFRELGPFYFYDYIRRRNTTGNPDLLETRIHHVDARAEWFPGDTELLAASVFFKHFQDPIEKTVVNQNLDFRFENTPAANLVGLELEGRLGLGRIAKPLSDFRVGANVALVWSQIELAANQQFNQTNAKRPLQGQSPFVVNAFLQWSREQSGTEAGVFYNVYGPRITEVGTGGVQDFYEQPFHQLDLVVSQRLGAGFGLKGSFLNLLNQSRYITSGAVEQWRYRPGVQFQLALTWNFTKENTK